MTESVYQKYLDYQWERENLHVIEHINGFALCKIMNNSCYVQDVYVDPAHRRGTTAKQLYDKIEQHARAQGCKQLLTTHDANTNNVETGLAFAIRLGLKIVDIQGTVIVMAKEI